MTEDVLTDAPQGGRPQSRPLAVVTGPSSGIGRELARQLAEHGFDLLIRRRSQPGSGDGDGG